MATNYLGQILLVGFNFAPTGTLLCNGQLLSISQYTALFALLGTTYGGNGTTTFALPDLRGRVPVHQGQGPGLSVYTIGETGGTENVTLLTSEMPQHNHTLNVVNSAGTESATAGASIGNAAVAISHPAQDFPGISVEIYSTSAPNTTLAATSIGVTGGNLPHLNLQPFLVMNYVIVTAGIFPTRN